MRFVKSLFYSEDRGKQKVFESYDDCEKWMKKSVLPNHSDWFEYLDEKVTKFYLDWDREIDRELTNKDILDAYKLVLKDVEDLQRITSDALNSKVTFYCATRTGDGKYYKYDNTKKNWKTGYKLSLRFYFNFGINYTLIPFFLNKVNQSHLWDTSIYSQTQQKVNLIGCVKNNKDNRVLLPYNENGFLGDYDVKNYIIQDITNCIEVLTLKYEKPIKILSEIGRKNSNNTNKNYKTILKIIQNNFLNKYSSDYSYWIKIGMALKNDFEEEGKHLFHLFSAKSEKYDEYECEKVWNQLKPDGRITIGTIKYLAKKENEELFLSIVYDENSLSFYEVFKQGAQSVLENIREELDVILKYSTKKWYQFNEKDRFWRIIDNPYTAIGNICRRKITNEYDKLKNKETKTKEDLILIEELKKMYRKCESYYSDIERHLKNEDDINFIEKLDKTEGKIIFRNGIYDLEKKMFVDKIDYDDYLTECLPYNYISERNYEEEEWVKNKIKQICNNNEEDYDIFMRILGYALTGYSSNEQHIYTLYGPTAGNGKSVLFEILDEILPIYSKKIDNKCFLENYNKAHKELIQLGNKRIVWTDEIPKKKLNVELIKEFANGKKMSIEKLFGINAKVNLNCKLFITTNNLLKLESDGGSIRRYVQLDFNSKFYENQKEYDDNIYNIPEGRKFLRDKRFCKKIEDKYLSLIHILIEYAEKYLIEGLNLPDKIKEQSKNNMQDSDCFYQLIETEKIIINTEIKTLEYVTPKNDLLNFLKIEMTNMSLSINDIKDYVQRYGVIYDRTKKKNGERGCFIGMKIKED